jgi:hypothetical protein
VDPVGVADGDGGKVDGVTIALKIGSIIKRVSRLTSSLLPKVQKQYTQTLQ